MVYYKYGALHAQDSQTNTSKEIKETRHIVTHNSSTWERNFCDLCCTLLTRGFVLSCKHEFCDQCIVALTERNRMVRGESIECPLCLTVSTHLITNQSHVELRPSGAVHIPCQAFTHKPTESYCAEYYCVQSGELLCPICATSAHYANKVILPAEEAAEQRAGSVRDKSNQIRVSVGKIRQYVNTLRRSQASINTKLNATLSELQTQKATMIASITEKFTALEQELIQHANNQRDGLSCKIADISQIVGTAMDTVSSCEKHAAQQHPLTFLFEAETIDARLAAELANIRGRAYSLCKTPPGAPHLPQLSGATDILAAVRCLKLSERR